MIEARFRVRVDSDYLPRYNIAPTQPVLCVVARGGERATEDLRWGLVPSWAKNLKAGHTMINARAETVGEKPAFRDALAKRRCLVPADGFYEWRGSGKNRTPIRFTLASEGVFAFAGLWDTWRSPDGVWVPTCTIITTTP
ncbi:MAG: SOS response-associated peptidase, partial [Chloroflexota bacterium]